MGHILGALGGLLVGLIILAYSAGGLSVVEALSK